MTIAKGSLDCAEVRAHGKVQAQPGGRLRRLIARLRRWQQLRHERQQLWRLSDAMLKDIGLSRGDVEREASRPFWDDDGWRR